MSRRGRAVIPHRDEHPPVPRALARTEPALPRALGTPAILSLQRTAGNRAVTALLRSVAGPPQQQKTQVGDATLSFGWNVRWAPRGGAVTFASGDADKRELTMPVRAGTEGKLGIYVEAHVDSLAHMPGQKPPHWILTSRCEWVVQLGRDGRLTLGDPALSHDGGHDSMVQQSGPPQGSANRDVARFTLTQAYEGEAESTEWSIPVWGGGGGSTGKPANTHGESFVVALDIQGIEGPQVEIGKVQVFQRQIYDVHFFTETNMSISGGERAKLLAWYAGLSKLTRRRLRAGTQKMRLEAYASNTGKAKKNHRKYATGRLRAVHTELDRFVTKWDPPPGGIPYGEDKLPDSDNLEPAEERRGHEHADPSRLIARLIVEDERTPGADDDDDFDLLPTD